MESQTKLGLLKEHICSSQNTDLCDQCVRPWHDGICDCGHSEDDAVKQAYDIGHEFINSGQIDKLNRI